MEGHIEIYLVVCNVDSSDSEPIISDFIYTNGFTSSSDIGIHDSSAIIQYYPDPDVTVFINPWCL